MILVPSSRDDPFAFGASAARRCGASFRSSVGDKEASQFSDHFV